MERIGICPICYRTLEIDSKELSSKTVMCIRCAKDNGGLYDKRDLAYCHPYHSLPGDLLETFYHLIKSETRKKVMEELVGRIKIRLSLEDLGYFNKSYEHIDIQTVKEALSRIPQYALLDPLVKIILESKNGIILQKRITEEILTEVQEKIGREYPLDAPNLALATIFLAKDKQTRIAIYDKNEDIHISSKKELKIETLFPGNLEIEKNLDSGYNYQYIIRPRKGNGNFIATISCRSEYDPKEYTEHTILVFICNQPEN